MDAENDISGPKFSDVIFTLFRHKWKIAITTIIGFLAAACVYFMQTPLYQTEAKLFVRYVLDRSTVDPVESTTNGRGSSDSVIGSEVEILTSWDLALQVAEGIGIEKLVPNSNNTANKVDAASAILSGLSVSSLKGSNVILVSYKNRDPALAVLVLEELVNRYFTKHLEVHRSAGAFDFVTQQTDQVRARLNQTEDELKRLKAKAHVISLNESTANLSSALAKIREELYKAEAERAEQRARVDEIEKLNSSPPSKVNSESSGDQINVVKRQPGNGEVQQYEALVVRLAQLRQGELDLLSKYTAENTLVKLHQTQIVELENQRKKLEEKFPTLVAKIPASSSSIIPHTDLDFERTRLAGTEAKIGALKDRESTVKEAAVQFSEVAPLIAQLERKKELEESDFKYFGASLEKARIDEALDPSKMPNISAVQKPSPAVRATNSRNKLVLVMAAGGVAFGIIIAIAIDFLFNTTIKMPLEIEARLKIPLLLSIPYINRKQRLQTAAQTSVKCRETGAEDYGAPWELGHFIRTYAEALRDRLVLYFEIKKMVYKPKLVAVTSCSRGEGISTIAAGLAAALSETGDGKVLLVDMNVGGGNVHRFFEGRQTSSLIDAIEGGGSIPSTAENLYLAKASPTAGTLQIIPKRFYDLIPHFKATDFDYIIFDLPPLAQGSIALAMSGFMDKVLLVVESEKSPRDAVKRTFDELVAANADVSVVFNKMHSYAPSWVTNTL